MTSPVLFHGPGAMGSAHVAADEIGRQVAPPVGGGGLKAEDARQAARLLRMAPMGAASAVLIIGPVDGVRAEATDVLLKPLEEYQVGRTLPILWAHDAGSVPPTVTSRCQLRWCPDGPVAEDSFVPVAEKLVEAWLAKEMSTIIEVLKEHDDSRDLILLAGVQVIAGMEKKPFKLWGQLRGVLRVKHPTSVEVLVAWLP